MQAMRRLISRSGLSVAALLVLTACGGEDTEATTATPGADTSAATVTDTATAAESTTAEAGGDPVEIAVCDLLSDEVIEAATGRTPASSKVWTLGVSADEGEFACSWSDPEESEFVHITVWAPPADVNAEFEELRSGLFYDEDVPSPGIGDDSFYRLAGVGELGTVVFLSDGILHKIDLSNPSDAPATAEQEEEARRTLVTLAEGVI